MTTHSSTLAQKIHSTLIGAIDAALEKALAPYSSTLAWKIPGTGEPGGLPSMRSHRVEHDWSDLAAAAAGRGANQTNNPP